MPRFFFVVFALGCCNLTLCCDAFIKDFTKNMPLFHAAQMGHPACVRALVKAGAKLQANTLLQNAFHVASTTAASSEVMRELLRHPRAADFIDVEDCLANSPLYFAIRYNQLGTLTTSSRTVFSFLLRRCANAD